MSNYPHGNTVVDAILSGDILREDSGKSYNNLDIGKGGQYGWSPALGDINNAGNWMNNAAYVKQNAICILLDYPRAFDLVDKSGQLVKFLTALLSVRSKTINGINMNMTVNTASHQLPNGQEHKEFVGVKRAAVNAQHSYQEVAYKPIVAFHEYWIRLTRGDENNTPPIMAKYLSPGDLDLPHLSTATAIYIEPDSLHRNVIDAAIVTNMFPDGDMGEREIKADKNSDRPLTELSYSYGGIGLTNANVIEFAQKYLESLSPILHADSNRVPMYMNGQEPAIKESEYGFGSAKTTK